MISATPAIRRSASTVQARERPRGGGVVEGGSLAATSASSTGAGAITVTAGARSPASTWVTSARISVADR